MLFEAETEADANAVIRAKLQATICASTEICARIHARLLQAASVRILEELARKCASGRKRKEGNGRCPHGRRKHMCKECGGASICPHGQQKYACNECGGASICPHGRYKCTCKECGGAGICAHGRRKQVCKDCGGSAMCANGRHKQVCKEFAVGRQSRSKLPL